MRALLKRAGAAAATLAVAPLLLRYRVAVALFPSRRDELFEGASEHASRWPGIVGSYLRVAFYRRTLRSCSPDCRIGYGTLFATPEVDIGAHVYIGAYCNLGHVTIGDDTLLGSNVTILSGKRQHHFDRLDVPVRLQGGTYSRVEIGADAWLGNGSIVMADVGTQAIVAAGSIVTKAVAARTIVAGNPAQAIASREDIAQRAAALAEVTA